MAPGTCCAAGIRTEDGRRQHRFATTANWAAVYNVYGYPGRRAGGGGGAPRADTPDRYRPVTSLPPVRRRLGGGGGAASDRRSCRQPAAVGAGAGLELGAGFAAGMVLGTRQ